MTKNTVQLLSVMFLCGHCRKTNILLFLALLVTACFFICVMIVKTDKFPDPWEPRNPFVDIHQIKRIPPVTESARTFTENIRVPSNEESRLLYEKVRVFCLILTMPLNHDKKARHVKATWGRRCNRLVFMSSVADPTLGTVNLNVSEGRQFLWNKTHNAFRYVYEHHIDDADWFLKADDDTYVIVENLRFFLGSRNSSKPIYFGYRYSSGFVSGGAGYVLSRRAVELLVEDGIYPGSCPSISDSEDVQISACLKAVGVESGNSRDSQGRDRFFPSAPEDALVEDWEYYDEDNYKDLNITKPMRCSNSTISFHYVTPSKMYVIEYLIYHLQLRGGAYPEQQAVAYRQPE